MRYLIRQAFKNAKLLKFNTDYTCTVAYFGSRNTFVPTSYENGTDPSAMFFAAETQALLRYVTRAEAGRVFRKRVSQSSTLQRTQRLRPPLYKFLTEEQLREERARADATARRLLQMPPVVKVREDNKTVLSQDVALTGLDTAKFVFTDISFGISNEKRIVVERDTDGTLRYADNETKKRMNQVYFPLEGRRLHTPAMLSEEALLLSLLERGEHEFVLDRACLQLEPDEPLYHTVSSITYQHIDANKLYDALRSTRHFGPLAFYLTWQRSAEGLMLDVLQSGRAREAVCLAALRHALHGDLTQGDETVRLAAQIVSEGAGGEEREREARCVPCLTRYVTHDSRLRGLHELALQTLRESHTHTL